jgi:hypothetical protein
MEAAGSTVVLVDGTIPPRTAVPAVIAAIRGVGALPRTGSMSGG